MDGLACSLNREALIHFGMLDASILQSVYGGLFNVYCGRKRWYVETAVAELVTAFWFCVQYTSEGLADMVVGADHI